MSNYLKYTKKYNDNMRAAGFCKVGLWVPKCDKDKIAAAAAEMREKSKERTGNEG